MTRRIDRIREQLNAAFSPSLLEITDDSAKHAGHAGARPEGETHYTVVIEAPVFEGLSRVAMHRRINDALKAEFEAGLHALSVTARAP